jgi:hypothetical protein
MSSVKTFAFECCRCGLPFQTNVVLDRFCGPECEAAYWRDPVKVAVTKNCQACDKEIEREVYSVQLCGLMLLPEMCGDCSDNRGLTLVGNNKVWAAPAFSGGAAEAPPC